MPQYTSDPHSYLAYTDETRYNVGRVRGLGMLSMRAADTATLSGEVRQILGASSVRECKWEHMRSARTSFAAAKLLEWAIGRAIAGTMRVDTLTWDASDHEAELHALPHIQRLHQMYALLLGRILPRRWPPDARFQILPDEQQALHWERITGALSQIEGVAPARSEAEPLIQVADLFVGLSAYSRAAYDTYERWLAASSDTRLVLSASDRYRCQLLDDFFTLCKLRDLHVSLRTNRGLRTYDASPPLCFWWEDAI
jgi:hypothetical protein